MHAQPKKPTSLLDMNWSLPNKYVVKGTLKWQNAYFWKTWLYLYCFIQIKHGRICIVWHKWPMGLSVPYQMWLLFYLCGKNNIKLIETLNVKEKRHQLSVDSSSILLEEIVLNFTIVLNYLDIIPVLYWWSCCLALVSPVSTHSCFLSSDSALLRSFNAAKY